MFTRRLRPAAAHAALCASLAMLGACSSTPLPPDTPNATTASAMPHHLSQTRAEAEAFAAGFLRAFEDLDMPRFIACFADDATVFFPLPEPPQRFDGKPAIQARFQQVFNAIRADAPGGPPYHHLNPLDLQVQPLGTDAAIVTFHLRNAQRTARRTLVLQRQPDGSWLIAHLHASNVAAP